MNQFSIRSTGTFAMAGAGLRLRTFAIVSQAMTADAAFNPKRTN